MRPYDAVVVGGGIVGAATLYALSRVGLTHTLLVERGTVASGATGHSGGMMRVFHRDPGLSDLTAASLERFRRFRAETGQTCGFVESGAVYVARQTDAAWVAAEVARLQAQGVAMHLWDAAEASRHLPLMQWQPDDLVVHEPHAGYADPRLTVEALLAEARSAGAKVVTGRQVTAWQTGPAGVVGVDLDGDPIATNAVVVAAGTGSRALLASVGLGDALYAKAIQVDRLQPAMAVDLPCWLDARTLSYGRSGRAGEVWFGAGLDERPSALDEQPCRPEDTARALALATARVPGLAGARVLTGSRIADAYTPDRKGLLGAIPDVPGLFVATGWGGTGFMIALAVGERLAALVADRHPTTPVTTH